jgi:hypothetical protein
MWTSLYNFSGSTKTAVWATQTVSLRSSDDGASQVNSINLGIFPTSNVLKLI